jgi:hypothetical protein
VPSFVEVQKGVTDLVGRDLGHSRFQSMNK